MNFLQKSELFFEFFCKSLFKDFDWTLDKMKKLLLLLMLLPMVNALEISEIMYNPLGTDTGKEWIEVYGLMNLSEVKLYENNINHGLTLMEGSDMINGYAIIVNDYDAFKSDYPASATIFESSFSLKNSEGEYLALTKNGETLDDTTYEPIASEGNSIIRNGETWLEASPTPGYEANQIPEFNALGIVAILFGTLLIKNKIIKK